MKIVFSRKGFDSGYGGIPSPIFPDGGFASFPIPAEGDPDRISDLSYRGTDLGALAFDLTSTRFRRDRDKHKIICGDQTVHLDPDINRGFKKRPPGWRPTFGPSAAANTHLKNHGVGIGDVFLFFGWFREVEKNAGKWRYVPNAPDLHVIFGWLQVGSLWEASNFSEKNLYLRDRPWLKEHPHVASERLSNVPCTLYISRERLLLGKREHNTSGAGTFESFGSKLVLTEVGQSRTHWLLPTWMAPSNGKRPLSYHGDRTRWEQHGSHVRLRSVAKGQEFVLHGEDYPESVSWLESLICPKS